MPHLNTQYLQNSRKQQQYQRKPKRLRPQGQRAGGMPDFSAPAARGTGAFISGGIAPLHLGRAGVGGLFALTTLATAACLSSPLAGLPGGSAGTPELPPTGLASRRLLQGRPPPPPTPPGSFGTMPLHTEKIGFYVVPDIDPAYLDQNTSHATLTKVKELLPDVWLRWDNEWGHAVNNYEFVDTIIGAVEDANISLIISASAAPGYNNYWANNNSWPTMTIEDVTRGQGIETSLALMQAHPDTVKMVNCFNEIDGPWFDADPNNVTAFQGYLSKLQTVFTDYRERILCPCTAFRNSPIFEAYLNEPNVSIIDYHNYQGAPGLTMIPGKEAWITEYGGMAYNPAAVAADYFLLAQYNVLANNPLEIGSIAKLFYNQFTDNGGNRGAINHAALESDHFAFRDWFRSLLLIRRLSTISPLAFADFTEDFMATDDRQGRFGLLFWNNANSTLSNGTRSIFGTSLTPASPLHVVTVVPGDVDTATCLPLAQQRAVDLQVSNNGAVVLSPVDMPAFSATLISTEACDDLAD